MFNLFKKSQAEIVAKIHHEFDSAAERLLAEAKEILSKPVTDNDIAERLSKLGFSKSKLVKKANDEKSKASSAFKTATDVEYFKTHYPDYKYITDDEVKKICKKYGLVLGKVSDYTGTVPEKNLYEMERFALRDEDCHMRVVCEGVLGNFYFHPFNGSQVYTSKKGIVPGMMYPHKPKFKICAPQKDFDMEGKKISMGFMIVKEDPIVLQPVKNGYLVVSKWGLEGEDEMVNVK